MSETGEAFWMVWNEGGGTPRRRHTFRNDAEREADRLALANPGQRFYVLIAESFAERNDLRRVKLEEPLPF